MRTGNKGKEKGKLGVEEQWKRAIKEAPEETIQAQKPIRKENWLDEECVQIIDKKKNSKPENAIKRN